MYYLGEVSYKLEKIRKLKGYSQEYIANKLGISQNSYGKIERGKTRVNQEKLRAICEVLEVDVKILLNFNPRQELTQLTETEGIPSTDAKILHSLEKVAKLYEELLAEKNARIKQLEEVIAMLKCNR